MSLQEILQSLERFLRGYAFVFPFVGAAVLPACSNGTPAGSNHQDAAMIDCRDYDNDKDGFYAIAGCGTPVDCDDHDDQTYPQALEQCDYKDNNCNRKADEGVYRPFHQDKDDDGFGNPAVSACAGGRDPKGVNYVRNADDCDDADPEINPGRTELCNGVDDNCNGSIDEAFPELGNFCSQGIGECWREGVYRCAEDGSMACSAVAGIPREEECDGRDNDCDKVADNVSLEGRPSQECSRGIGACQATGLEYALCLGAEGWSDVYIGCTAVPGAPVPEGCDGMDNDCDDETDEGGVCGRECTLADLVSYLNFDEEAGDTAYDSSISGLDGTMYGGASRATSIFRTAIELDGIDDRVAVPDHDLLDLTSEITVKAWVRRQNGTGSIVDKYDESDNSGYALQVIDGKLAAVIRGETYLSSSTLPFSSWVPVAFTYNSAMNIVRLYVDAAVDAEYAVSLPGLAGERELTVGAHGADGNHFQGRLDETKVYSCALPPGRIFEEYTGE